MNAPSPDSFLFPLFNAALNAYLSLDSEAHARIRQLDSALIGIDLIGLSIQLHVHTEDGRLRVQRADDEEPQVWIRGRPAALISMAMSGHSGDGSISIEGDADVAARFNRALGSADIDWEEWVSQYAGDAVAHQLGQSMRAAKRWAGETRVSLALDLKEYLTEEIRVLPTRYETEKFIGSVDSLSSACDRLEARIARLEAKY